jgi:peptidoglycan/LPS O-acetylase OafA/YrhL
MIRSVLAVIGGYVVVAVAVMALFAAWFRDEAQTPTSGFMALSLAYGFVFTIVGGYAAAWIAGRAELAHGAALAVLMAVLGVVSLTLSFGQQPLWYQVALILSPLPAAPLGGWLRSTVKPTRTGETPAAPTA